MTADRVNSGEGAAPSPRGSAFLIGRLGAITALNYAFSLAIAWLLGPTEFGKVAVVLTVLWLAAIVLNACFPWLAAILVARSGVHEEDVQRQLRGMVVGNEALAVAIACLISVLAAAGWIWPTFDEPLALLATLACLPLFAFNSLARGLLQGSTRFGGIAAFQIVEVVVKAAAGVVFVVVLGLKAEAVPVAFLLGAAASALVAAVLVRDLAPAPRGPILSRSEYLRATPMLVGAGGMALLLTLDVLILAGMRGVAGVTAAAIGVYQVAAILARIPYFIADAFTDASFPYLARASAVRAEARQLEHVVRRVLIFVLPLGLVLLVRPEPVVQFFFPEDFIGASTIVRVLTIGAAGMVATNVFAKTLQARGRREVVAGAMGVALTVEVVVVISGTLVAGTLGAATGFAAGACVAAIILGRVALSSTEKRYSLVELLKLVVPAVIVCSLVLLLPADGALPVRMLQIAVALLVFAGALLATGLIGGKEFSDVLPERIRSVVVSQRSGAHGSNLIADHPRLLAALIGSLAFLSLSANITRSPDTIYDEAVYTRAAQSVANSGDVTWTGAALFVHPPLFFGVQALVLKATGRANADYFDALHVERLVSVAFMAGAIAVLILLALALSSRLPPARGAFLAISVAGLAAFDPVLVRYARLNMLEAMALCAALLSLYLAFVLGGRRDAVWIAAVGISSGLALLVKEITIFLVVAPLVAAVLSQGYAAMRRSVAALGVALLLWAAFPMWALVLGEPGRFAGDKFRTFDRLLGLVQVTGWNRPGVSFMDVLVSSLSQYASSYLLLATGALALLWLGFRHDGREATFLLGLLIPTYALGVYSVARGQFNEQFFTYLMPGAILATVFVADSLVARARARPERGRLGSIGRRVITGILVGCLAFGIVSWGRFHAFTADEAIRSATRYLVASTPDCTVVNASGDREKYAVASGRRFSEFASGPRALSHGVHDFLISPHDVSARYTSMTPALARWIRENGNKLATFPGHTYGGIELWHVPSAAAGAGSDVLPVAGGAFVTTQPAACGGIAIRDNRSGNFFSQFLQIGGISVAGKPLTRPFERDGRNIQIFERVVLESPSTIRWAGRSWAAADRSALARVLARRGVTYNLWADKHPLAAAILAGARTYPIVSELARSHPKLLAPLNVDLRNTDGAASAAEAGRLLTDPAFRRYYLRSIASAPAALALQRPTRPWFGFPLGPSRRTGDTVRQAFSGAILERPANGTLVTLAPVGAFAERARLVPRKATRVSRVPNLDTRIRRADGSSNITMFLVILALAILTALVVCFTGAAPWGLRDVRVPDAPTTPAPDR